ncbi:hypothetical protein BHE74_00033779 [Ensete ventricosum]|nr:hypothetical protein BHE74_00033779 [Ensete ventricosum]
MDRLPEGCVAHAIALTSPRDACRFSAVSSCFRSAAAYDTVWDRFLPSDYRSILSRAVRPVVCSSKRDLFFRLCDSLLIDAGKMVRCLLSIRCSVFFRITIIFFSVGEFGIGFRLEHNDKDEISVRRNKKHREPPSFRFPLFFYIDFAHALGRNMTG